jgi:hypothetical protein
MLECVEETKGTLLARVVPDMLPQVALVLCGVLLGKTGREDGLAIVS